MTVDAARTRRVFLGTGLAALVGAVASTLGRASTVAAANGDPVMLGVDNTATTTTTITYTNVSDALRVNNNYGYAVSGLSSNGTGVRGSSSVAGGAGVQGFNGSTGNGVAGGSNNGTGVRGYTVTGAGVGVHGSSTDATGVYGESQKGFGVHGESSSSYAVIGVSGSSGGVVGFSDTSFGVLGSSSSLVGVQGQGGTGRGGRFSGGRAQIKLDPSTASTHPASGQAGDIFLDKSKRLWLCKGGTSWVRLDL